MGPNAIPNLSSGPPSPIACKRGGCGWLQPGGRRPGGANGPDPARARPQEARARSRFRAGPARGPHRCHRDRVSHAVRARLPHPDRAGVRRRRAPRGDLAPSAWTERRSDGLAEFLSGARPFGRPGADNAPLVVALDRSDPHALAGVEWGARADDRARQHLRAQRAPTLLGAHGHLYRPRRADHRRAVRDRRRPAAVGITAVDPFDRSGGRDHPSVCLQRRGPPVPGGGTAAVHHAGSRAHQVGHARFEYHDRHLARDLMGLRLVHRQLRLSRLPAGVWRALPADRGDDLSVCGRSWPSWLAQRSMRCL